MANCKTKLAEKYKDKYKSRTRINRIDDFVQELEASNASARKKYQEVKNLGEHERVKARANVNSIARLYKNSDMILGDTFDNPAEALLALWEGSPKKRAGSILSVENIHSTYKTKYQNYFTTHIEHTGLHKVIADKNVEPRIFQAYMDLSRNGKFSEGTSPAVRDAATMIHKFNTALIRDMQEAGSSIMFNGERIIANMHESDKILADIDGWIDYIYPKLDVERSFGAVIPPDAIRAKLRVYAEELKESASGSAESAGFMGGVRGIYFRDGRNAFEYNETYGQGSLLAGLFASIDDSARKTAVTEVFGDNPIKQYNKLKELAMAAGAPSTVLQKADNAMYYFGGRGFRFDNPESTLRKLVYETKRNATLLTQLSKLGKSASATFQDIPTIVAGLRTVDNKNIMTNVFDTFSGYLKTLSPKERRRVSEELMVLLDDSRREFLEMTGSHKEGVHAKVANAYATMNLTKPLTNKNRATAAVVAEKRLKDIITKDPSELDRIQKFSLETLGLTESEKNIAKEAFASGRLELSKLEGREGNKVLIKLGSFMNSFVDDFVVTHRARSSRQMGRHLPKDDSLRIVLDLVTNLRSSLLTLTHAHEKIARASVQGWDQMSKLDKFNSMTGLATTASALLTFSAVKIYIGNQVAQEFLGEKEMKQEDIMKKAVAESMIGGLAVDAALNMATRQYWKMGSAPVETTADLFSPITGKTRKQRERWKKSIPGQNLWFVELFKANMVDQMQTRLK